MMNGEKELNENKHFFIKYAFIINGAILLCTFIALYLIKINDVPILTKILNYYTK